MFNKTYTLKLINQVIKEDIIPSLNSSVAKEQAIAMISVLKNVNLTTEQNMDPYMEVNVLIQTELSGILQSIAKNPTSELTEIIKDYQLQLQQVKSIDNVREQWEELNKLLSNVIKSLYQFVEDTETYIKDCRSLLRKQLNIEMSVVG